MNPAPERQQRSPEPASLTAMPAASELEHVPKLGVRRSHGVRHGARQALSSKGARPSGRGRAERGLSLRRNLSRSICSKKIFRNTAWVKYSEYPSAEKIELSIFILAQNFESARIVFTGAVAI